MLVITTTHTPPSNPSLPSTYHQTPDDTTHRLSYHARWRRLGLTLEGLRTTVHSVTPSAPSPQRVEIQAGGGGGWVVGPGCMHPQAVGTKSKKGIRLADTTSTTNTKHTPQVHATVSCHPSASSRRKQGNKGHQQPPDKNKNGTPLLEVHTTFVIYGSGDLRIKLQASSLYGSKHRTHPLHLPRLGLALRVPKAFSQATWLGLGPHECYADRKTGARLGVHAATVEELYTPYVVPSAWAGVGVGLVVISLRGGDALVRGIEETYTYVCGLYQPIA